MHLSHRVPLPRLYRAALNQYCGGDATASRYGIWANTVRDNIRQADAEFEMETLLKRVAFYDEPLILCLHSRNSRPILTQWELAREIKNWIDDWHGIELESL
jgi:hypothetical protein